MKKILYLSYDGLTDPLGQSQILPYIFGLVKKGYRFTIISFEKKENQNIKPTVDQLLKKHSITWIAFSYTKKPPIISTLLDIYRLRKKAFSLFETSGFDLVHCRSYITSLVGLEMKIKLHLPFIFDMRGFWADERVDGNLWNLNNPLFRIIYKYFKKKEHSFILASDHIISLTNAGKLVITQKLAPKSSTPIQVIPCCVDTDHFDPKKQYQKSQLFSELKIEQDSFVLGYIGSIGTWYMLPEMMDFFAVLIKKKPEAIFLFVTKEPKDIIVKEALKRNINEEQLRIISATRQQVPEYISLMKWSIFFIKPLFSKQASSPTKQGELMSMGVPIITNNGIGDTDEIIEKYQSGLTISEFSDRSYNKVVDQMFASTSDQTELRKGSIDYFGLENGVNSYWDVYENCLVNSNNKE